MWHTYKTLSLRIITILVAIIIIQNSIEDPTYRKAVAHHVRCLESSSVSHCCFPSFLRTHPACSPTFSLCWRYGGHKMNLWGHPNVCWGLQRTNAYWQVYTWMFQVLHPLIRPWEQIILSSVIQSCPTNLGSSCSWWLSKIKLKGRNEKSSILADTHCLSPWVLFGFSLPFHVLFLPLSHKTNTIPMSCGS